MRVVAFDTETARFSPGRMAPPLACISYADEAGPKLIHGMDGRELVEAWLDSDVLLVGHNVAYDVVVLMAKWPDLIPRWFDKYERNQVTDTMLRQQLLDIRDGCFRWKLTKKGTWVKVKYGLSDLHSRYFRKSLEKDSYRTLYGAWVNTPLAEWPEGAREYPKEDARATLAVYRAQGGAVEDEHRQSRYALSLHLASVWGVKTDAERVARIADETKRAMWELEPQLKDARLLKRSGQKNTKAIRSRVVEKSTELHYTDKGDIAIDADVCKKTEDPLLVTYAKWSVLGSTLHKDVPMLSKGTVYPIHTNFGLAASGRVTSNRPNVQNFGRKGGIRECFVPRPGYVYVGADYPQLELRTVSQVLLEVVGWSKLADSLNAGKDVHCELASTIVRRPYEEVLRGYLDGDEGLTETRRVAKAGNFGFPGGMQPAKFVDYCLSQGTPMTEPRGAKIREGWLTTYREFTPYFDWIRRHENRDGTYTVKQLYSNRVRGRMSFTEACNTMFQGLGADCAKYASYCVSRACYANPNDALYGSRIVLMVHDELVLEVPEDRVHEAGRSLAHWMAYGANKLLTKVPISVEPVAMRYYSKKAKAVYDANGRLVPWE